MRAIMILLILCVACSTKRVNTLQMYDVYSQDTIDYYKDGKWYKMTIPLIETMHDRFKYKITQIDADGSFYTIYAHRNDSIYQIFSPISDINTDNKSTKTIEYIRLEI